MILLANGASHYLLLFSTKDDLSSAAAAVLAIAFEAYQQRAPVLVYLSYFTTHGENVGEKEKRLYKLGHLIIRSEILQRLAE